MTVETGPKKFEYNRTFGEATSNASRAAWEALFPAHGRFFKHPNLAPKRSALSVFHQLHCLVKYSHLLDYPHSPRLTSRVEGLKRRFLAAS